MLLTPHILVGAAIGTQFNSLLVVAPLAALSHMVMDSIPHWDPHIDVDLGIEDLERKDIVVIVADLVFGAALLSILAALLPNSDVVWLGGFCAALPDAQHLFHVIFGDERINKWRLGTMHNHRFNWSQDTPLIRGLILQVLIAFAAFAFIISQIY